VLDDTSRLTATVAQVVELGAADLTAADDFDALDQRRVDREHALDAFAVRDLPDGEVLLEARTRTRDADAFVGLNAGARTFGHANQNADGVARLEFRKLALGFNLGGLFGLELTNDVHRPDPSFFSNSQSARHLPHQSLDRKSTRLNFSHVKISYAV